MIPVSVVGVVHDEPQVAFTAVGTPRTTFTLASTPRWQDGNGLWHDGETTRLRVIVWRQQAEHVAACLTVGARVVVTGQLYNRSYEGRPGPMPEIEADEVAASLRFTPLVLADRDDLARHSTQPPPDEAFEVTT